MELSELSVLITSEIKVISVQTQIKERETVLQLIERQVAHSQSLPSYLWNLGQGKFTQIQSNECDSSHPENSGSLPLCPHAAVTPEEVFRFLLEQSGEGVFIVEDLHPFFGVSPTADIQSRLVAQQLISQLVNITQKFQDVPKYLLLLGTQEVELPESLQSLIPEIWNPFPDFNQIASMLVDFLPQLGGVRSQPVERKQGEQGWQGKQREQTEYSPGTSDSLVAQLALSAGGLTLEEIKTGLRIGKARNGGVDSRLVEQLLNYKIERLRSFNLQFVPQPDVPDFGGLDRIKTGITEVRSDYTTAARASGLPLPKGWLLVGPPGTGKTFVSKFCAKALSFPMISVDTGAVSAGGASYLKRLIARVEAAAPAVVYFDEFDKLFPGSNQISEDVNSRQVLGLLLTWLQDKTSKTFVIATLNRLDALPPELTRVGRFDEIYYVGFPQAIERKEILHLHLARFDPRYRDGADPLSESEWRIILGKTINCTGAELSRMVEKAARRLFHNGKEMQINLPELLAEREAMIPLYVRDTDRILRIENLAKYVAQPAASPDMSLYAPPLTTFWGEKLPKSV
jgi:MoxR-like ATPase